MKGIRKGFVKVGFFALGLVLGISLLAGCAAPAETPATPPASPSTITQSPALETAQTPAATPSPVTTPPAAAPAAPEASTFPIEIKDDLGRVVTIKKVPQRIISIAPSNTEILYALGLGDKVVGVDQYSDYPAEAKAKASLGGYSTPSIEKIVSLNPDLILATSIHQPRLIPALEEMHYTVVALDPKTLEQTLDGITLVGKITGNQAQATEVVKDRKSVV